MISKDALIQDTWKTIRSITSCGVSYCNPKIQEMLRMINQLEDYEGEDLSAFFNGLQE